MMQKKISISLIVVILSCFAQAKGDCPEQCVCSEDFSVVKCRGMEEFPVFDFASKVKTLDLTHGKIKTIHEKDVMEYRNLERLFIGHNPLDCDHATTHTLKYILRERIHLKSFDGHKIKCERRMPNVFKDTHGKATGDPVHHGVAWAWPSVHLHSLYGRSPTPGIVAGILFITVLSMIAVAGLCWVIVMKRRKTSSRTDTQGSKTEDPVSQMEEGACAAATETDSTAEALMEGLKKQRRSSQGFPENAIVDSEDEDVVEQEDYLREKMRKQRRMSQGYADGSGSSDEESNMVQINLNENLYSSGN